MAARRSPVLFASSSALVPLIMVSYDLRFSRRCCWLYCQFLGTAALTFRPCSSYSCLSLSSCLQGIHYFHCTALFVRSDAIRVDDEANNLCLNLFLDFPDFKAALRRKMKCLLYWALSHEHASGRPISSTVRSHSRSNVGFTAIESCQATSSFRLSPRNLSCATNYDMQWSLHHHFQSCLEFESASIWNQFQFPLADSFRHSVEFLIQN